MKSEATAENVREFTRLVLTAGMTSIQVMGNLLRVLKFFGGGGWEEQKEGIEELVEKFLKETRGILFDFGSV